MHIYIYIYIYTCVCVCVSTQAIGFPFPGTELQTAQLAPDHWFDVVLVVAAVATHGLGLRSLPGT